MGVLDCAAGGGRPDAQSGVPAVTLQHVQSARRLIAVSVAIQKEWRVPFAGDDSEEGSGQEDTDARADPMRIAQAVEGHYMAGGFDAPTATQGKPVPAAPAAALVSPADPGAATGDEIWRRSPEEVALALDDEPDHEAAAQDGVPRPLSFSDLEDLPAFDANGFGDEGDKIFSKTQGVQVFKDRELMRRLLLSGRSHETITKIASR